MNANCIQGRILRRKWETPLPLVVDLIDYPYQRQAEERKNLYETEMGADNLIYTKTL